MLDLFWPDVVSKQQRGQHLVGGIKNPGHAFARAKELPNDFNVRIQRLTGSFIAATLDIGPEAVAHLNMTSDMLVQGCLRAAHFGQITFP